MGTINEMTVVREQEASDQEEHQLPPVCLVVHYRRSRLLTAHSPKTLELSRAPKYPRKSVPHEPRMDASKVLIHPLNTESAMKKVRRLSVVRKACRG
jgi:hypothetical protein